LAPVTDFGNLCDDLFNILIEYHKDGSTGCQYIWNGLEILLCVHPPLVIQFRLWGSDLAQLESMIAIDMILCKANFLRAQGRHDPARPQQSL
jgi:hypothetical protein